MKTHPTVQSRTSNFEHRTFPISNVERRTTPQSRTAPQQLREELQDGDTRDLRRRRGIVALSLIGMASMAPVTLYQMWLIRHLPDPPPLPGFDSDRVNASDTAY